MVGTDTPNHLCHARGCRTPVRPALLMCYRHWKMVPRTIQRAVWAAYRAGQTEDMEPSNEWMVAADAAIGYVAASEGMALRMIEVSALGSLGYGVRESEGRIVVFERP